MNEPLTNFLYGALAGCIISIPFGPGALYCVQRTLTKGRLSGFISGLGTATSDCLYATLALLCLSYIQQLINQHIPLLFMLSGIMLMIIGITIFATHPIKQFRQQKMAKRRILDYVSAFVASVTNPGGFFLILSVLAFLGHEIDTELRFANVASTLSGILLGAITWWLTLSGIVYRFKRRIRLRQLWNINRLAGLIMCLLGIIAATRGVYTLLQRLIY